MNECLNMRIAHNYPIFNQFKIFNHLNNKNTKMPNRNINYENVHKYGEQLFGGDEGLGYVKDKQLIHLITFVFSM